MNLGVAAVYALARAGSAVSPPARAVQVHAESIVSRVESSGALFGGKTAVISELWQLRQSHGAVGWDGAQAWPVDSHAIALAVDFIRALPDDCTLPEVGVDPDGAVSLDWMASRNRMVSVSITGDGSRLAYAWIDGSSRGHEVARFDGIAVPTHLLQAILTVTSKSGHVALRAA